MQLSNHWAVGAGYRYIDIDCDYDQGEGAGRKLWSMVNKGPYLAVQIGW